MASLADRFHPRPRSDVAVGAGLSGVIGLVAPIALVFLKGCLLGLAIAGVIAVVDDVLVLD